METILLFLNGYDKNIINNKKAIAVLTINTAIAFYYSFSLGSAVTDIHSAFTLCSPSHTL